MWPVPPPGHPQQRGLLLGAGDGDAQIVFVALPERHVRRHGCQDPVDVRVLQRLGVHPVPAGWLDAGRQELHRADAVPADGGQQVEGVVGAGTESPPQSAPDRGAVGQQVVEVVRDRRAAVLQPHRERQRQRQGPAFVRPHPGLVVAQHGRAGAQRGPHGHEPPIHPDVKLRHSGRYAGSYQGSSVVPAIFGLADAARVGVALAALACGAAAARGPVGRSTI